MIIQLLYITLLIIFSQIVAIKCATNVGTRSSIPAIDSIDRLWELIITEQTFPLNLDHSIPIPTSQKYFVRKTVALRSSFPLQNTWNQLKSIGKLLIIGDIGNDRVNGHHWSFNHHYHHHYHDGCLYCQRRHRDETEPPLIVRPSKKCVHLIDSCLSNDLQAKMLRLFSEHI